MAQPDNHQMHCNGNIIASESMYLPLPEQEDGSIVVYMADHLLLFTADEPESECFVIRLAANEKISRAKIITFLGNYKNVAVVAPQPRRVFEDFAAQFVWVEAAGGVVVSEQKEGVMIRRNERWDLPKGHREQGESFERCAAREAEEETGVKVESVGRLLCTTLHCYNLYGRWELKLTAWYEMWAKCMSLTPQSEEGIASAEWVPLKDVEHRIKASFPTIKQVFASL